MPIFGICLGHQLLGLAVGGEPYKLKFGHRGGNQPVMNLATGRVEITSQNHGFAVDRRDAREGRRRAPRTSTSTTRRSKASPPPDRRIFSVQYHPEAAPGPHDATYLFDCFTKMMETGHSPTAEEMDEAQRKAGGGTAASANLMTT